MTQKVVIPNYERPTAWVEEGFASCRLRIGELFSPEEVVVFANEDKLRIMYDALHKHFTEKGQHPDEQMILNHEIKITIDDLPWDQYGNET